MEKALLDLVLLQQRLEAWMVAEGVPHGIEAEQPHRQKAGDRQLFVDQVQRLVGFADTGVDLGQLDGQVGSVDRIFRDRDQLGSMFAGAHRLLLPAEYCEGVSESDVETVIVRPGVNLVLQYWKGNSYPSHPTRERIASSDLLLC